MVLGLHGEEGYRIVPFQSSEILANETGIQD